MSSAHGHECTQLSPFYKSRRAAGRGERCRKKPCCALADYQCSFRYVTGRMGRITTRTLFFCAVHTEQWCRDHGIAYDPQPTGGEGSGADAIREPG